MILLAFGQALCEVEQAVLALSPLGSVQAAAEHCTQSHMVLAASGFTPELVAMPAGVGVDAAQDWRVWVGSGSFIAMHGAHCAVVLCATIAAFPVVRPLISVFKADLVPCVHASAPSEVAGATTTGSSSCAVW